MYKYTNISNSKIFQNLKYSKIKKIEIPNILDKGYTSCTWRIPYYILE
jgi:hypothetical protein